MKGDSGEGGRSVREAGKEEAGSPIRQETGEMGKIAHRGSNQNGVGTGIYRYMKWRVYPPPPPLPQ